jgi:poly(hydroxyalkanoate) granule-associated protein
MNKPKFKSKSAPSAHAEASSKASALMESAQQVWSAGKDALTRAQGQGGKLFENLVKEGMSIEQKTRKFATGKVDEVRDVVETKVEKVKERASDTWDKLEKVFEDRVSRALGKLGVPGRDEMEALVTRVEELSKAVKKLNPREAAAPAKKAAAKAPAKAPAKKGSKRVGKAAK